MIEKVRVQLTVRKDQKAWLEEHPEINVSGLLRKAIDDMRKMYGKRNQS